MMNIIKHKRIFLFVIIPLFIVAVLSVTKVRAMNGGDLSVVVIRIEDLSPGEMPNTLSIPIRFVARNGVTDSVYIQVPVSGSPRKMNKNIREALEKTIFDGSPVVDENDTLILLGAAEKL